MHTTACEVCLTRLPLRHEPRGRPRLYCGSICKERARRIAERLCRVEGWKARGRDDMAERVRDGIKRDLRLWRPDDIAELPADVEIPEPPGLDSVEERGRRVFGRRV
jgi:hypothetical protein